MKAHILTTDVPNGNGRIYPSAVMKKAIAEYKHPLRVYRSQQAAVDGLVNDIIGTGTIVQDGTNVYADIAFNGAALQQQVMQNGLSVRTSGIGDYIEGTRTVKEFTFTGLFVTDDPA